MSAGSTASGSSNDGAESDFSLNEAESEDGRTWDRNRPSANPLGETEADSSPSLQRKSSSAQDDDDPSPTTAFHSALGQQVDMTEDDDAPLGSA
jgi:hypothetical protein